jgi:hypothetical protein
MFSPICGIMDPIRIQAILYIPTNIYRTCTPEWDWWKRPREEDKKEVI